MEPKERNKSKTKTTRRRLDIPVYINYKYLDYPHIYIPLSEIEFWDSIKNEETRLWKLNSSLDLCVVIRGSYKSLRISKKKHSGRNIIPLLIFITNNKTRIPNSKLSTTCLSQKIEGQKTGDAIRILRKYIEWWDENKKEN